nr:hypothetical protein [Tanacetum cinerariifolium]
MRFIYSYYMSLNVDTFRLKSSKITVIILVVVHFELTGHLTATPSKILLTFSFVRGKFDLLDINDSDLPLTLVLRPCNKHVRETITITSTQDGIVQVGEVKKKPVRIISGPAGIVQLAKIRKQLDIHEGGDDSVLLTQEYMKQVVEDMREDEDFNSGPWVGATEYVKATGCIVSGCIGYIKTFFKSGKLEQVVRIIKSCSPNALGGLKVTVKDLSVFSLNPSMHYLNITKKNVVKVFHKDFVSGNGSGVEDLYKFDEEVLDLVLEEEASESRAHEEWLEKCRQQKEKDAEHEIQLLVECSGALGANKAITHPVIAIFLYPPGVVESACALEVDAMGALDLVEVEAVRALDLMEVGAV